MLAGQEEIIFGSLMKKESKFDLVSGDDAMSESEE